MKRIYSLIVPIAAAALALSSCSDYDNGYTEQELTHIKGFEDAFGKIDAEQDWNLAERNTVEVTVGSTSTVQIFALVNGTYSLVGEYAGVTGTQELGFDVVEGTEKILVSDGKTAISTTIGGVADFAASTRAAYYGSNLNGTSISVSTTNTYIEFGKDKAWAYRSTLPEINNDTKPYAETNLGKVTQNFKFVSNGQFSFYPVYWETSGADVIGIYYTDNAGYHEVDVYAPKSGDELQNIYAADSYHNGVPENVTSSPSTAGYTWDVPAISQRAKDITIDIPAGTTFGFYLKNGSNKFYSQAGKNPVYQRFSAPYKGQHGCYAASVAIDGESYLCFEDWYEGDFDLNDVVFKFAGNVPTVVDEDVTAATWILACEDLGGTFDADYNDVVLKVEHVSGQTTATVTPLAAGGTLASYIFFIDPINKGTETCLGEIHQLFGEDATVSGNYTPYNVDRSRGTAGTSKTITVDKDWSMAYYSADSYNSSSQYSGYNMGGFTIYVLEQGTAAPSGTITTGTSGFGSASIVAAPNAGKVPEMLCIPYSYATISGTTKTEYVWAWPRELQTIAVGQGAAGEGTGAYNNFAGWVTNHNSNIDWYKYPNTSYTVSELKYTSEIVTTTPSGAQQTIDDISGYDLTTTKNATFTYTDKDGKTTTYTDASFIDLSSLADITYGTTAVLYVEIENSVNRIYWDYPDGAQLLDDGSNGSKTLISISLDKDQLYKAWSLGGIYIMGANGTTVSAKKAVIQITPGTAQQKVSDLTLTTSEVTLQHPTDGTAQIDLSQYVTSSSTGTITYESGNSGTLWATDNQGLNGIFATASYSNVEDVLVTIKQEATGQYAAGSVVMTVHITEAQNNNDDDDNAEQGEYGVLLSAAYDGTYYYNKVDKSALVSSLGLGMSDKVTFTFVVTSGTAFWAGNEPKIYAGGEEQYTWSMTSYTSTFVDDNRTLATVTIDSSILLNNAVLAYTLNTSSDTKVAVYAKKGSSAKKRTARR